MRHRLATLVVVVSALATTPAHAAVDLTGTWKGDDRSTYDISQSGTTVRWNGRSDNGRTYNHDFVGAYDATTGKVSGSFQDRPGYDVLQAGKITVHVEDACHLTFASASVGWGTHNWTKQSCSTSTPDPAFGEHGEIVALEDLANGCGGDLGELALGIQNYLGNTSVYTNSRVNPLAKRYRVNFKPACDLHDAGYEGVAVTDMINGGLITDYSTMSRRQVDLKFLRDMQKICKRQIPKKAKLARRKCMGTGGLTSFGARHRYELVRSVGSYLFDADPTRPGRQTEGPRAND